MARSRMDLRGRDRMADAHAAPQHDYHLVPPSPWPLVSSIGATIMFIGAVIWMKGLAPADSGPIAANFLAQGKPGVFFAGLAGVLISAFCWWSDVIKESKAGDHTPVVSIGLRYGMILFIASEVMFFVAFFWMFFDMALFHESRALTPEVGTWADTAKAWVDLAAEGRGGVVAVAAAAVEHRDPAAQRLHRHLGAPRHPGRGPQGRQDRPGHHGGAGRAVHLRPGL